MITIESTCVSDIFVEVMSSRRDVITAKRACGKVKPGENVLVEVRAQPKSFLRPYVGTVYVTLIIGNGKIEIPVKFVD